MANIGNSKLKLQEHQEEAYENVEKLFENGRYAAVIFPTGCGKSFVTLEYMLKHPNEKILILSPRNAIKDQMYEYVVRYIGGLDLSVEEIKNEYGSMKQAAKEFIPNIECMLYQTISKIGENENLDKVGLSDLISKNKKQVLEPEKNNISPVSVSIENNTEKTVSNNDDNSKDITREEDNKEVTYYEKSSKTVGDKNEI